MFHSNNNDVGKLKEDLWFARRIIISLVEKPFEKILEDLQYRTGMSDYFKYEHDAIEDILALTKPMADREHLPERANCPLCRQGADSPSPEGFALFEGLRRHLSGYGNMLRCPVFDAARNLAIDNNRAEAARAEEASQKRKLASIAERKTTETLYRIGPDREPELIDNRSFNSFRSPEQMKWAEERLAELGFDIKEENNVRSYQLDSGGFIVFSDPREIGDIVFRVYDKAIIGKRLIARPINTFRLRDVLKLDLPGKYRKLFDDVVMNYRNQPV